MSQSKIVCIYLGLILLSICYATPALDCQSFPAQVAKSQAILVRASPEQEGFSINRLKRVDDLIQTDINNGFPGAALLIIKNGKVIKDNVYGYRLKYNPNTLKPLTNPIPLQCDTLFDLASNTKIYATTFALMHLVYQGKLDINKSISYYLPEYSGCDSNNQCRKDRTIRELLSHQAGYMPDPQFFNPQAVKRYGTNLYSQNRLLTESIILTRLPFASSPGGKPSYSDVDFILLGMVIERITKLPLDDYLEQNIYHPLGLSHTTFTPLLHGFGKDSCAATEIAGNTRGGSVHFPNIRTHTLQCQVHDEKAFYSMGQISGHAGLFSDLADMGVLTSLLINNGRYANVQLWDKSVQSMFIKANPLDDTFGLGFRRSGTDHAYQPFGNYTSIDSYGHTGWTGTMTLIDPKNNLVIILLTNKKHSLYKQGKFNGDKYQTGKYYPVIDLIYQSLIDNNSK